MEAGHIRHSAGMQQPESLAAEATRLLEHLLPIASRIRVLRRNHPPQALHAVLLANLITHLELTQLTNVEVRTISTFLMTIKLSCGS